MSEPTSQLLNRLRVLQQEKEQAVLAAKDAEIARLVQQFKGYVERSADDEQHLRARAARLEAALKNARPFVEDAASRADDGEGGGEAELSVLWRIDAALRGD